MFANGRVRTGATVRQAIAQLVEATAVATLELTPDIAATAVQLPSSLPADPADRLIVSTALVHELPLVTREARIQDARVCNAIW